VFFVFYFIFGLQKFAILLKIKSSKKHGQWNFLEHFQKNRHISRIKKKIAKIFGGFGQIFNFSSFEIAKFI
jgi:hypothetical protein